MGLLPTKNLPSESLQFLWTVLSRLFVWAYDTCTELLWQAQTDKKHSNYDKCPFANLVLKQLRTLTYVQRGRVGKKRALRVKRSKPHFTAWHVQDGFRCRSRGVKPCREVTMGLKDTINQEAKISIEGMMHLCHPTSYCSPPFCVRRLYKPDLEPGPRSHGSPGKVRMLGSRAVLARQNTGRPRGEAEWDATTALWAPCRAGRLGEVEALGRSWPEDVVAVCVSQLPRTASLSDAWTCGQTLQLRGGITSHNYKASYYYVFKFHIHLADLTVTAHALSDTFLESAALAAVAAGAVDRAVALSGARVLHTGRLTSAEEALCRQNENRPVRNNTIKRI